MLPNELIFNSKHDIIEVDFVERQGDAIILTMHSKQGEVRCPKCKRKSSRIHGYYTRAIKDLPAFGSSVIINLKARKFYCLNAACTKKVFAEQFPDQFLPYKRTTERLNRKLLKIALLMGGNAGERLCHALNIQASNSSLIRCIHKQKVKPGIISPYIGIDDWAYKKGHTYGTVIVDLKQRRIIDLLPDREAHTVEAWLKERPWVKVVTRDRYSKYARAAKYGAPTARQVADRWHLLKNMGDAIKKMLERKRQDIRKHQMAKALKKVKNNKPLAVKEYIEEPPVQSRRHLQLQEIKKLHANGTPIRNIARSLRMSRNTVRKYIHLNEPPRKDISRAKVILFSEYF